MDNLVNFNWPAQLPRSELYTLRLEGTEVPVFVAATGHYAIFPWRSAGELVVGVAAPCDRVTVRPARHGGSKQLTARELDVEIEAPAQFVCEFPGQPDLYVLAVKEVPRPTGPGVLLFEAGKIHEVGTLELTDGQHVHIEGGAVVKGTIQVHDAANITITGNGILDNSVALHDAGKPGRLPPQLHLRRGIAAERCRDVRVQGITILDCPSWGLSTYQSQRVAIEEVNILNIAASADGIDICGSREVTIRGCFVRAGDDCIAMKGMGPFYFAPRPADQTLAELVAQTWAKGLDRELYNVEDVLIENCAVLSYLGGSGLEMGQEMWGRHMRNVTWRNIDVLGVHNHGSAISIRNSDHATVRDVTYEDIRIEHHFTELIGMYLYRTRYSVTPERGRIQGITLKNIQATVSQSNEGYSPSHLRGWSEANAIEGVHFENFDYGGKRVRHLDDFNCFTKYAHEVTFA